MHFDTIGSLSKISTRAVCNQPNTALPVVIPTAIPISSTPRQFKYKCEDKAAALLTEEGITDINGKVHQHLTTLSKIPLNPEEKARVEHCFTVLHEVMDSYDSLKIQITAKEVLKDLFGEVFDECELIGSAAFYSMGVSFCKRFAQHLFETALHDNEERVPEILNRLFNPEFEAYLESKFNKKLADIDARLTSSNHSPHIMNTVTISRSFNATVTALIKKLPMLSIPKEIERRVKALGILREKLPGLDWDWVDVNSPQFYQTVIKALAFNKLAISTKEGELLGILNIGKSSETTVDFVFALKLARREIFPSVVIPCRAVLSEQTSQEAICPTGENWVQGMVDKLTGRARPNVKTATEEDAKMLLCALTKGEVNPVKYSDKILINIAKKESLNEYNKTTRKILKTHPELRRNLKDAFPYFFAQQLKEAVDTHLGKDPKATMAMTINAVDMLNGSITCEEMKTFISEMQKYWVGKSGPDLIYHLAYIMGESYELENYNELAHKLSIIKLCAFLRCQASNDNKSEMVVYPRHNGGEPALEIIVKGEKRDYSLMLKLGNTSHLLRDAIKYINIARPDYTSINRLLKASQTTFQGPLSSPMFDDLEYVGHQREVYERSCSHLLQHQPLLGTLVSFATQTQSNKALLTDLLVNMPRIIHRMKASQAFVYENLTLLLTTPDQKKAVAILSDFMREKPDATEVEIAEHWVTILSENREWLQIAHECFVSYLHQNPKLNNEDKSTIVFNQLNQIISQDPQFALKLLHFVHQKEYVSFKGLIEPYTKVRKAILNKPESATFAEDVLRLEKIALSLYKNGNFGFDEIEHFKKLVKPLVPHSQAIASKLESFDRVSKQNAALQKEAAGETVDFNQELAALVESDYEEAATVFFRMSKNHRFPRSSTPLLPILHRLLQKASQDKNVQLAISLLKQPDLRDFLALRPEKYFEMMLNFSEECQKNKQNELSEVCLIAILKTFKPNEQLNPTPTEEILRRLVNQVLGTLNEGSYSDESTELARVFILGFDSLYSSLEAREMSLECVRIYHQAHVLGDARLLQKFAGFIIEVITELKPNEAEMFKILDQVDEIIPSLAASAINLKKYKYFEIVVALLIYNKKPEKIRFYLNHLFNIDTLSSKDDLELLYELFEKFKDKHLDEALCLLEAYKGPWLSPSEIEEAKLFIPELHHIAETKDWLHLCQALAVNPFTWNDPIKLDVLGALGRRAINGMLTQERLSLQELKWIFTILNRYKIQDPHLICTCIERCEGVMDVALANKMWEVFNNHVLKADIDIDLNKTVSTLLAALKLREKHQILSVLDNRDLVNLIVARTKVADRLNLFKSLMKANVSIIKLAKTSEKVQLLKQFDGRVNHCVSQFWHNVHRDADEAVMDVIEYYVSTSDNQMVPEACEHLCWVQNSKTERYKELLTRIIACVPRKTTPDVNEETLLTIINDAQKAQVSFTILFKCFAKFRTERLITEGLLMLFDVCDIPNYTNQEMRLLPTLGVYEFLKRAIAVGNLKSVGMLVMMLLKPNNKMRLFMKQEEYNDMITVLAKHYLPPIYELVKNGNYSFGGQLNAGLDYVAKYSDVISRQDAETYKLFISIAQDFLIDEDIKIQENLARMLTKLAEDNGVEKLCIFANHFGHFLRIVLEKGGKLRTNSLNLIDSINDHIVKGCQKSKITSKAQLDGIREWAQWQLRFNNKISKQKLIKFVEDLALEKTHPQLFLELQIALMVVARHEVEKRQDICRAQPEMVNKAFWNFFLIFDKIRKGSGAELTIEPETWIDECIFALECFKSIPHTDSVATSSTILQSAFVLATATKTKNEQLKSLMGFWLEACEQNAHVISDVLKICIIGLPKASIDMLEEKLFAILRFAAQKKLWQDVFCDRTLGAINDFFAKLVVDPKRNEDHILRVFAIHQKFVFQMLQTYMAPKDYLNVCERYPVMIKTLVDVLKSQLIIKKKSTLQGLLTDFELYKKQVPKELPPELLTEFTQIKGHVTQTLKNDLEDIFRRYKSFLKE